MFDKATKKSLFGNIKNRTHHFPAKYIDFSSTHENFIMICFTNAFQAFSMLKRSQFSGKDRSTTRTENREQEIKCFIEEQLRLKRHPR